MDCFDEHDHQGNCSFCGDYEYVLNVIEGFGFCSECFRDVNRTMESLLGLIREQSNEIKSLQKEIESIRRILDHNDVTSKGLI